MVVVVVVVVGLDGVEWLGGKERVEKIRTVAKQSARERISESNSQEEEREEEGDQPSRR